MIKRRFFFLGPLIASCFVSFGQNEQAQVDIAKYFNLSSLPFLSRIKPLRVSLKWDMKDSIQVALNDGLNALDEGRLGVAKADFDKIIVIDSMFWPAHFYRGQVLKYLGDVLKAKKSLQKAIAINANIPECHIALGEIFEYQLQGQAAFDEYQKATQVNPNYPYGYLKQGNIQLRLGNVAWAETLYEKCNEIDPRFPDSYMAAGIIKLVHFKNEKTAVALFTKAVEADSTFSSVYFWRGLVYLNQKKKEKCLNDWSTLLGYHPNNIFLLTLRGRAYVETGDFDEAFVDFKKAVLSTAVDENSFYAKQQGLGHQTILADAANYLTQKGHGLKPKTFYSLKKSFCQIATNKAEGLESARHAGLLEPSSSAQFMQGIFFEYFQIPDSAEVHYSKAINLDYSGFEIFHRRSAIREMKKNWRGAYQDVIQMEQIRPGNSVNYRVSGMGKSMLKDYRGAIDDLTIYLKRDSIDIDALLARADAKEGIGDFKGANKDLQRTLWMDGTIQHKFRINQRLGENYLGGGDTVLAIRRFRAADRYNNNGAIYLPHFWLAYTYCEKKQFDSARLEIKALDEALSTMKRMEKAVPYFKGQFISRMENTKSDVFFLNGLINFKSGKVEESVKSFSKSLELNKDNLLAKYHRGVALTMSGNVKGALRDFNDLAKINFRDSQTMQAKLISQSAGK